MVSPSFALVAVPLRPLRLHAESDAENGNEGPAPAITTGDLCCVVPGGDLNRRQNHPARLVRRSPGRRLIRAIGAPIYDG